MSTKVIYKPVSGGEQRNESSVVFTIDESADEASGSHHSLGSSGSADDIDDDLMIQQFSSNGNLQHMEISNSFDDDFTEHMFGFKDPWLPSVLITLGISTPLLTWNAYFFANLVGTFMVTIPFVFHLLVLLWTAKYLVNCSRLSDLQSPRTRLATSVIAT